MRLEDVDQKQRGLRYVVMMSGGLSLFVEEGWGSGG